MFNCCLNCMFSPRSFYFLLFFVFLISNNVFHIWISLWRPVSSSSSFLLLTIIPFHLYFYQSLYLKPPLGYLFSFFLFDCWISLCFLFFTFLLFYSFTLLLFSAFFYFSSSGGFKGFARGLAPSAMRSIPACASMFATGLLLEH